jgi:hypothetical protein
MFDLQLQGCVGSGLAWGAEVGGACTCMRAMQGLPVPARFALFQFCRTGFHMHAPPVTSVVLCEGVLGCVGRVRCFWIPAAHFVQHVTDARPCVGVLISRWQGGRHLLPCSLPITPHVVPKLRCVVCFIVSVWGESLHWYQHGLVVGCCDWSAAGYANWYHEVTFHAVCVFRHAWADGGSAVNFEPALSVCMHVRYTRLYSTRPCVQLTPCPQLVPLLLL